jgi:hypothetical protein
MITLSDLFAIILTLTGLLGGGAWGASYGILWGVAGALGGGVLGFGVGQLPGYLEIRRMRRELAHLSPKEIRSRLHDPGCWTPNYLLMELRARGEDIADELPLVLRLMESEVAHHRTKGFAALLSAYPEIARAAEGYDPTHAVGDCGRKVAELRRSVELKHAATATADGDAGEEERR